MTTLVIGGPTTGRPPRPTSPPPSTDEKWSAGRCRPPERIGTAEATGVTTNTEGTTTIGIESRETCGTTGRCESRETCVTCAIRATRDLCARTITVIIEMKRSIEAKSTATEATSENENEIETENETEITTVETSVERIGVSGMNDEKWSDEKSGESTSDATNTHEKTEKATGGSAVTKAIEKTDITIRTRHATTLAWQDHLERVRQRRRHSSSRCRKDHRRWLSWLISWVKCRW